MLKILFIGEINGRIGRMAVEKILPDLKKSLKPDLVIANADNLAHGNGVSKETLEEMSAVGVDWFTGGDHCFGNVKSLKIYESEFPILRPANYSQKSPGKGYNLIELKNGCKILLISLIGRVFMRFDFDDPFVQVDEILSNLANDNASAIIVDMHAEATSEKAALFHYLNGRVSTIIGSHTHVMTADAQVSELGTAFISDVGMTGFADGVLGVEKEDIIKTFLTQIKYPHIIPKTGRVILNAVFITVDPKTKKTVSIEPITKFINI
ncbi:YmdB family metallophosphoesterase [Patescibacteria group bacterium]|nr:YmdB family metallophosphoesterase [Patescibacteria group bacterium]MBU0879437.1 YmdB family metallophosphoesterase [Patescibacteria group bacterium]MBU0880192.1 YmdB family metallophosphoesterase [Patescibacteria group bacterium]MBU0897612.1 YmdB family metallophosphoesterase [Patescibacteria group bacterium]MBU1062910.1 YmdB family metallophosphoesterase [Patescibacteria group bacterium]